jgi:hypothetical protein
MGSRNDSCGYQRTIRIPARSGPPVEPLNLKLPDFGCGPDRFVVTVPDEVQAEIWHHRWQVLTAAEGIDPLDAHTTLTQLKTAFPIAVLHGRAGITDADWKIAGQLTDVSATMRAQMQDRCGRRPSTRDCR